VKYDRLMRDDVSPKEAFAKLKIFRLCCRVVIHRSSNDSRLRRVFKQPKGFAVAVHAPRNTRVYTLATNGMVDPIEVAAPTIEHVTVPIIT